jgi:hypothetical protein
MRPCPPLAALWVSTDYRREGPPLWLQGSGITVVGDCVVIVPLAVGSLVSVAMLGLVCASTGMRAALRRPNLAPVYARERTWIAVVAEHSSEVQLAVPLPTLNPDGARPTPFGMLARETLQLVLKRLERTWITPSLTYPLAVHRAPRYAAGMGPHGTGTAVGMLARLALARACQPADRTRIAPMLQGALVVHRAVGGPNSADPSNHLVMASDGIEMLTARSHADSK